MIYYTSGWSQNLIKSTEQWEDWVKTLKDGDLCLLQEFVPRSNSCLGSQCEHWKFSEVIYEGSVLVDKQYDKKPIKNGFVTYWNSETKWGEVFDARIVPYHSDIAPNDNEKYKSCHAPLFDEYWTAPDMFRHLVLKRGKLRHNIKGMFKRSYLREVAEGQLLTIFGNWEDITPEKINSIDYLLFLYSEPLNN